MKSIWNNQPILKKNKVGEFTVPDFKSYYKATVITRVQC